MSERIALFPLGTVLFPQGVLPLRIFETRYVDMVRRVMREQSGFGVVLIRQGAEVGAIGDIAAVGTYARIVDFDQMPDGLLKIVARGERRFRVLSRDTQPDGLHFAQVEWLEDVTERLAENEYPELRAMLAQVLADLAEDYPAGESRMEDALWVSGQLGQLLPAPLEFRQRILEADDPKQRLDLIESARANN
ncbi:MAG: LON peptidase substrate-binding domain-containing protein [Steroidobacteraceae bacterium]